MIYMFQLLLMLIGVIIAPLLLVYSLIRIISGNTKGTKGSRDLSEYNAVSMFVICLLLMIVGDLNMQHIRANNCIENKSFLEYPFETCLANARESFFLELLREFLP